MPHSSAWYRPLDLLADSVNPILALIAIAAAIVVWRRTSRQAAAGYAVAMMVGLACIYIVQPIWRAWVGEYSTHAAFAASLVVSMSFWLRRRFVFLFTILLAYLVLIVVMGYHTVPGVVSGSAVACAVTIPWHFLARSLLLRHCAPPA